MTRGISPSLGRYRTTQTQNKRIQTSMPRVGFEPTIPAFERAKAVHALDRVATVIGQMFLYSFKIITNN
jgi:FAD synthase